MATPSKSPPQGLSLSREIASRMPLYQQDVPRKTHSASVPLMLSWAPSANACKTNAMLKRVQVWSLPCLEKLNPILTAKGLLSYAETFCTTVAAVQKKRDFRFPWNNPTGPSGPNMQSPPWAPFGRPTPTTPSQGQSTSTAAVGWPGPVAPQQSNWWQPPNFEWPPRPEQTVWWNRIMGIISTFCSRHRLRLSFLPSYCIST